MSAQLAGHAFQGMLVRLSGKISCVDLEAMKFTLEEELPIGDLQPIQQPFELFRLMRNKNLLSPDNCDRLACILRTIGREDLSNEILESSAPMTDEVSVECRLSHVGVLPCKTPHFYGRNHHVEEIVNVLNTDNGCRLVVITGLPGYGKSCLAQQVGHIMLERSFQVIFLSLREIKCATTLAGNILGYFNTLPGRKPCMQALSKLVSLTQNTILILDNAEDLLGSEREESRQEFGAFVNDVAKYAKKVKCVVASRISFPACLQVHRYSVELLELETKDAALLLKEKAQIPCLTDHEAESIAHLCLNVPLILHAAAALMTIVGPHELIQMLESPLNVADMDHLSPDLKMRRFLEECFCKLEPDLQEALISLAVFPAAFTHHQALNVLNGLRHSDGVTLFQHLVQLVTRSLVHSDRKCNQYFVHRVIKLFCEEKAIGDERFGTCYNKAKEQFIVYNLSLVRETQKSFLSKGMSKKSLCDYCSQERNVVQAILWALNDKAMAMQCAEALNESVLFLAKVMKRVHFEEIYEAVLAACKENTRLVADCLTCLGLKLLYGCECHCPCAIVIDRGHKVLQRAKELYENMGLTEGDLLAQCYSKMGRCMAKNGNPEGALQLTAEALEIREKQRKTAPLKYAACCHDRAVVLSYLQNHQEALTYRESALAVYIEELDDHPFTASIYNYLGNDCLALDQLDKAIDYFTSALRIRKQFFGLNHQETARTLHDMGLAYKTKGNFNEALARLKEAVSIQDAVFDDPHEKLKSLELLKDVCEAQSLPATDLLQLQEKIHECEQEKLRATVFNNQRLDRVLETVK